MSSNPTGSPCRDCVDEWAAQQPWAGMEMPRKALTARYLHPSAVRNPIRPAPFPGPRCTTHHRAVSKTRKEARHGTYVRSTYGLAEGAYPQLYAAQGGVCAICNRATGATRKLSVDHDHACCNGPKSCGRCVRGLLCRPCNDMLGHCRDSMVMLGRAVDYLKNPPAKRVLKNGNQT